MRQVFTNYYGSGDSWMIEFESGEEVEKVMKFLEKGITDESLVGSKQTETVTVNEKGNQDG